MRSFPTAKGAPMPSALRAMLAATRQQELIRKAERERQAAGASGAAQLLRRMHGRLVALCRGPLMSSRTNDVVLGDGSSIHIRPLRVEDRAMYERAVCGLSPRSRYLRFAAPMPRISERLLDQMMRFDGARHVVYAALSADE